MRTALRFHPLGALGGAVLVVLLSFVAVWDPLYLLAVIPLCLLPLVLRPQGRVLMFVLGTFSVFSSSEGVSFAKIAFLAVAILMATISSVRVSRVLNEPWSKPLRSSMLGSGVIVLLIALASSVGVSQGAPVPQILRDSTTYFIIAAAVPIAIDAASVMSLRTVNTAVVLVTAFAGVSFTVAVLSLRGVSNLSVERFGLPSMMALTVGVGLASVRALESGKIQWRWFLFAAFLLGAVLASGSREGLILIVATLGSVAIAIQRRAGISRVIVGWVTLVLALLALLFVASRTITNATFLQTRIEASLNVIQNGTTQDASGFIRARATSIALTDWSPNRLFGVGFGHSFIDPNPGGGTSDFQIDTSAVYLAKFGIIGCVLLAVAIFLIVRPAIGHVFGPDRLPEQTAVLAAAAVWVVQLYFGSPTEDKGFSLAVLMAVLVLGVGSRSRAADNEFSARTKGPLSARTKGTR